MLEKVTIHLSHQLPGRVGLREKGLDVHHRQIDGLFIDLPPQLSVHPHAPIGLRRLPLLLFAGEFITHGRVVFAVQTQQQGSSHANAGRELAALDQNASIVRRWWWC